LDHGLKRSAFLFLLLSFAAQLSGAADPRRHELDLFVDRVMSRPPFQRTMWGIVIESDAGEILYAHNADRLFVPASNRKLMATSFISACLPLDASLETRIERRGEIVDGVLEGDLVIVGGGDPSFAGRFFPDRDDFLRPLATTLRDAGIRSIHGDIVADASLFAGDIIPSGWKIGYLSDYYAAPVDALAFNENVIGVNVKSEHCHLLGITTDPDFSPGSGDLRCNANESLSYRATDENSVRVRGLLSREAVQHSVTELVAVRDPALYTAQGVRDFLQRQGISSRGVRVQRTPLAGTQRLTSIASAQMATILPVVLQDSQNLYTEMLHRRAAAEIFGTAVTLDDALEVERTFLTTVVGLRPDEFTFGDASGLATDNLVTPVAVVKTLRYLLAPERRQFFWEAMAHPGDSGTLHRRLVPLHDRVAAKTGSLNGVTGLSGALLARDGSTIYFSILMNHFDAAADSRSMADAIVTKLAELY
jgi:D-alanyl-D-alanine carboxypeptidase/D-alanyl-D-alanine-endopeptidase (penicillin-binding protein 4)